MVKKSQLDLALFNFSLMFELMILEIFPNINDSPDGAGGAKTLSQTLVGM